MRVSVSREAESLLEQRQAQVQQVLGHPVRFGPWWDASVTFSSSGDIATAQYVLTGAHASADLRVGVIRPPSASTHWARGSQLLYTLCGPQNAWRTLLCDITMPGTRQGGLPADRVDLLHVSSPAKPRDKERFQKVAL